MLSGNATYVVEGWFRAETGQSVNMSFTLDILYNRYADGESNMLDGSAVPLFLPFFKYCPLFGISIDFILNTDRICFLALPNWILLFRGDLPLGTHGSSTK